MPKFLSQKDIAVEPDRSPVRAWRAWGDRAMPSVRKRSQHQRWIFGERAYPAPEGTHESGAQDGRPTLDDGFVENADRLLDRLREVHGER